MSSRPELRLDWCSHTAAAFACKNWHYAKSMPVFKTLRVGAWERGSFIGAIIFGIGSNNNIGSPYGVKNTEVCELVRVALRKHETAVSRIVALAQRFLVRKCSGLRLIISYADPAQGHHGGIYQALGWIYEGSKKCAPFVLWKGQWVHMRTVTGSGLSVSGLPTRPVTYKHKYLMPLDAEMRAKILPIAKPYPKRAGSDTLDTPAHHAGEGGSLPTPALQPLTANG